MRQIADVEDFSRRKDSDCKPNGESIEPDQASEKGRDVIKLA